MRHVIVTLTTAVLAVVLADEVSQHVAWALTAAAKGLASMSVTVAVVEYVSSVVDIDKESTDAALDAIQAARMAAAH